MNIALSNLLPIFISFVLGYKIKSFIPRLKMSVINKLSNISLNLLLIFMGVTVGFIPGILSKMAAVGFNAISIATASSVSIAVVLKIFHWKTEALKAVDVKEDHAQAAFDIMGYIKDPLMLGGLVVLGFVIAYSNVIPNADYDLLISVLLYLLIFFIGIKLSSSGLKMRDIFFNKNNIYMTFLTITASYAGAAMVSMFLPLSLSHSLAVSSGFGWYTLSGILFTKMNNPLLGSVAFLCDLFREAIALLLIPTLSRIGNGNVAIGVAGATAMDVTLPVIEKHCGMAYVPVALLSGGIITVLVPFLIPFFYSL
ncbi:hypothetical protein CWS43_00265 [Rahnella sp. AA]|uniref:lysine exporter LysO family protein n=1 Tax=Rahnella sp. AA TaxID=2057180 RepID=UPI000C31DEE5|nr:lysine exporter LysO family protein [Rahnella sp. AA]PKE32378.1 hypothetical protein CWS43_00265 [Rahnella sp. AA]